MNAALPLFGALLIPVLLGSCATSDNPRSRIERNPEVYEALPAKQKTLVEQGRVAEGMSKRAVSLAWGEPDDISRGSKRGVDYEVWTYTAFDAVHTPYVGFGSGYGYWGYPYHHYPPHYYGGYPYLGSATTFVRRPSAKVEFLNGKVIGWESAGR